MCFFIECLDCTNQNSNFTDLKLRQHLFCNDYDKSIRASENVMVDFDFIFKGFNFVRKIKNIYK